MKRTTHPDDPISPRLGTARVCIVSGSARFEHTLQHSDLFTVRVDHCPNRQSEPGRAGTSLDQLEHPPDNGDLESPVGRRLNSPRRTPLREFTRSRLPPPHPTRFYPVLVSTVRLRRWASQPDLTG